MFRLGYRRVYNSPSTGRPHQIIYLQVRLYLPCTVGHIDKPCFLWRRKEGRCRSVRGECRAMGCIACTGTSGHGGRIGQVSTSGLGSFSVKWERNGCICSASPSITTGRVCSSHFCSLANPRTRFSIHGAAC